MKIESVIFSLGLFLLCSCSEQANLIVINNCGESATIIGDDGKQVQVPPGAKVQIKYPGTRVPVFVITQKGKLSFDIGQYPPREYRAKKYPYDVTLALEKDFFVYVCTSDGAEVQKQPGGFPIAPRGV